MSVDINPNFNSGLEWHNLPAEDSENIKKAASLLAAEFLPEEQEHPEYFLRALADKRTVAGITRHVEDETIAGIATYNVFPWENIESQLYLQPVLDGDDIAAVKLRRFEDMITAGMKLDPPECAVELAYNLVEKPFRGQGIGRRQWDHRLDDISRQFHNPLIFTLARSPFSGMNLGEKTIKVLLENERQIQGLAQGAPVKIQSVQMPIASLGEQLGIELASLSLKNGSPHTIHHCETSGFIPVGFSRNLCPVWVKQLP